MNTIRKIRQHISEFLSEKRYYFISYTFFELNGEGVSYGRMWAMVDEEGLNLRSVEDYLKSRHSVRQLVITDIHKIPKSLYEENKGDEPDIRERLNC